MDTRERPQTKIEQVFRSKILEKEGLTITDVAKRLGKSRTTIYEILNGKRKISRSLAFQLEEKFGESPAYWMNLNSQQVLGDGSLEDRLIVYGSGPLSGSEIIEFCNSGKITIKPFDINCVRPVSYDLRVKKVLVEDIDSGEAMDVNLDTDDLDLLPGGIAFVASKEKFRMPLACYGRLGQISELIHDGIVVEHGIGIDPGFEGRINCLMKNTGRHAYTLKKDIRFLSVELNLLPVPPLDRYNGYGQGRNGFGDREKSTINSQTQDNQDMEIQGKNHQTKELPDNTVQIESFINSFSIGINQFLEDLKSNYK